uniref:Integrase catalytic domain-containing protein n=1 Tax=Amphimedon queenslandica TaxID=400682 RepID=A0A1X7UQQ4_AMPQE
MFKITRHTVAPLSSFSLPDTRFDNIHVDIVGPLPPSNGYTYLVTCINRFTPWPEAIPTSDITASTVAKVIVSGWISRFGSPSTITTDRGKQFESNLWQQLISLLGSTRTRTTSHHPQANGMVERFHRQLKTALKAKMCTPSWTDNLPLILLVYEHTSSTPPRITPRHHFSHNQLHKSSHVFVRRNAVKKPLEQPYDGPFKVPSHDDKYFVLDINGKEDTVSVDCLKPAHLEDIPLNTPNDTSHQDHAQGSTSQQDHTSEDNTSTPITKHTRSGRTVCFPTHLDL